MRSRRVVWSRSLPARALTGVLAADGTPVYLSPGAVELHTGRRSDELTVATGTDLIHPDDIEALGNGFDASSRRPNEPIPVRYRTRHADGSWRIIEGTYTNLLADPDIAGIVLDVNDVTDRANAEAALRASEARNRRVIDLVAEGIILSGAGGQIVDVNPAAIELLGVGAEQMIRPHLARPALEPDPSRRVADRTRRPPRDEDPGTPVNRVATS